MSDPKERSDQGEPEELDLAAESIADLEPRDEEADDIRGGASGNILCDARN